MNYKDKLQAITTVKELFDFREKLQADANKYSNLWKIDTTNPDLESLSKCQDANFYITRIERRIAYLENKGLFLDSIEVPKDETNEK